MKSVTKNLRLLTVIPALPVLVGMLFLLGVEIAYSHPGNTASDGCHYCWTNCDSWGEVYGQRHCHGYTPDPEPNYDYYEPDPPEPNYDYSSNDDGAYTESFSSSDNAQDTSEDESSVWGWLVVILAYGWWAILGIFVWLWEWISDKLE